MFIYSRIPVVLNRKPDLYVFFVMFMMYFALCITHLHSQGFRASIKIGDKAFADGDYYSASLYYKKALDKKIKLDLAYKFAEASRLFHDHKPAEEWYNYVIKKDKNAQYPLVLFWYAMSLKNNGKYLVARGAFDKYYESHKTEDNYFVKKSKHEIESCEFAEKIIKDTVPVIAVNLGANVNASHSDFAAYPVKDSVLFFSSMRMDSSFISDSVQQHIYHSRIYKSFPSDTGWVKAVALDFPINGYEFHSANCTFSIDGRKLYFTRCNYLSVSDITCAIYMSEFLDDKWQDPIKLNDEINYPGYTSTQPMISIFRHIGEILFFVSNRPGGYGKFDIWYCPIYENGRFGKPKNLGKKINTIDHEASPYFHYKSNSLYFSSEWHYGLGGYDIFKSELKDRRWGRPENLGYPINTSVNDLYLTINDARKHGFLTSNRPGAFKIKGETCCNDIYEFEYQKMKMKKEDLYTIYQLSDIAKQVDTEVILQLTGISEKLKYDILIQLSSEKIKIDREKFLVDAKITSSSAQTLKIVRFSQISSKLDSNAILQLVAIAKKEEESIVFFHLNSTSSVSDTLILASLKGSSRSEIRDTFNMQKKVNKVVSPASRVPKDIDLPVINYAFDKANLSEISRKKLNKLINLLNQYNDMKIEISSHTDAHGDSEYNILLSNRRSLVVARYLKRKKIPESKFKIKWHGEDKPLASNYNKDGSDNRENRQINRRTEFRIIE
ncbi:OmpA family protein [Bacteroidales bacterium AH-315-N07]|nr:OmpA family protein [Bacteroidales bacterium AH-315-N07]